MRNSSKIVDRLGVEDLSKHPVWEYGHRDAERGSDRRIRPIKDLPVQSLAGRLVGVQVLLNNGESRWAVLSNITLPNPKKTRHFLTLWIEGRGKWFELARYFDVDYKRRGPQQLAAFLGLGVKEIFPISYDITAIAQGDVAALRGRIEAYPEDPLTEDEIIALALAED